MSVQPLPERDLSLFATFDFRAFLSTLRLRWWIVPSVLALTLGLLIAQQSRMELEPPFVRVSKSYEVPSPVLLLGPIGINPALITEFPDVQGQLTKLRGSEFQSEVSSALGADVRVQVPTTYNSPFVLSCESEIQQLCDRAIDKYAERAAVIRRDALEYTLTTVRKVFEGAYQSTKDPIAQAKVSAIDAILSDLDTELVMTDSNVAPIGASLEKVNRSKVIFGLAAGLFIALLILLQLTFVDSRIHTERQLVEIVGKDAFLGKAGNARRAAELRRAAVAIHQKLSVSDSNRIAFLPLRKPFSSDDKLKQLTEMINVPFTILHPFSEMSVHEIVSGPSDEGVVIVASRNDDLRKDLIDTAVGMNRSGRKLLGFLLLD